MVSEETLISNWTEEEPKRQQNIHIIIQFIK